MQEEDYFLDADTDINDEMSKHLAGEKERLKQNYYDSKFEYLKKKLEEK
jgi:hypothetical protein